MIGEMYRFSGVKAIEIPGSKFDRIAGIVEDEIAELATKHNVDVQAHYIPIADEGTTTSIIVMLHYGKNISPF